MEPAITPLDAALGATIIDIDLAHLDAATWQWVEDVVHEFGILIFPGQNLTAEA